jgi:hypothetical protein
LTRPDARKEGESKAASPLAGLFRFACATHLPLEHETALFVLVSLLDLLSTAWLIRTGHFRESNRVAAAVLHAHGLHGLLIYKFALVAGICVLVQVIARHRPAIARWLLIGATVLVAAVVVYGVLLFDKAGVSVLP